MSPPASPESLPALTALVQAIRTLPGAHPDRIGLFGHSRGSAPIMSYIISAGDVRVAILNPAGYPAGLSAEVRAPILILHRTADSPADGGVAVTSIQMARDFEAKLRAAGKPVEAVYYEGGRHNDIFTSSTQYRDEAQKMVTFLRRPSPRVTRYGRPTSRFNGPRARVARPRPLSVRVGRHDQP